MFLLLLDCFVKLFVAAVLLNEAVDEVSSPSGHRDIESQLLEYFLHFSSRVILDRQIDLLKTDSAKMTTTG